MVSHSALSGLVVLLTRTTPIEQRHPGAVAGSRLLPTDRAAVLQSGSPPGVMGFAIAQRPSPSSWILAPGS
jgi:hypothetical protein